MGSLCTDNAFARVLVAYETHKRSKLAEQDLRKIAKKYASKPAKLIADFGRKYAFPIPGNVLVAEVRRLLHVYNVPSEYKALLPSADVLATAPAYDPRLDPRSEAFDPEKALQADHICTPFPDATPMDNIYMAKQLLPGQEIVAATQRRLKAQQAGDSAEHGSSRKQQQQQQLQQQAPAVLGRIADSLKDSPYQLLWRHFHDQTRIRVLIRNVNSLRGTCEGYLKAFDKHMNLLMTDVKEVYTPTPSASTRGRRSSQDHGSKPLKRYLKQLLIRGDNIVLICAADPSATTAASKPAATTSP